MKLLWILLFPAIVSARALDNTGMVPLLSVGVGAFNVLKTRVVPEFQMEYRTALSIIMARPFFGAFTTSDLNFYLYAGIGWDLHFSKRIVLTPSFAPGLYLPGHGKNLGYPLEFRTSMELAYKFDNKSRLGIQFYHLSNASISSRNPGTEALLIFYSIPIKNGF
jgi:lipid A 3-O-deacylase